MANKESREKITGKGVKYFMPLSTEQIQGFSQKLWQGFYEVMKKFETEETSGSGKPYLRLTHGGIELAERGLVEALNSTESVMLTKVDPSREYPLVIAELISTSTPKGEKDPEKRKWDKSLRIYNGLGVNLDPLKGIGDEYKKETKTFDFYLEK